MRRKVVRSLMVIRSRRIALWRMVRPNSLAVRRMPFYVRGMRRIIASWVRVLKCRELIPWQTKLARRQIVVTKNRRRWMATPLLLNLKMFTLVLVLSRKFRRNPLSRIMLSPRRKLGIVGCKGYLDVTKWLVITPGSLRFTFISARILCQRNLILSLLMILSTLLEWRRNVVLTLRGVIRPRRNILPLQ